MIELTPDRALIIEDTAVVADLHLGLENYLGAPRMQIGDIVERLRGVVEEYSVSRVVVAGDLKHEFSGNLPYEWDDVETLVRSVDVELVVVRGNHDNFLAAILSKHGIELLESYEVHGWTIVHGHKPCDAERIVMGHEHPAVKVRYGGAMYSYPCFLWAKGRREVIVLPAFSPLVPGSDVLSNDFLSPILREFDRGEIEVYAVDEEVVYLGTITELRKALERKPF